MECMMVSVEATRENAFSNHIEMSLDQHILYYFGNSHLTAVRWYCGFLLHSTNDK